VTGRSLFLSNVAALIAGRQDAPDAPAPDAPAPVAHAASADTPSAAATPPERTVPPAVRNALVAMERLQGLLEQETAVVDLPREDAVAGLLEEKGRAEAEYRGAVAALHCEPGGLGGLAEPDRAALRAAAQRLAASAKENMDAVARAASAQKRLVELIVDTVKRSHEPEVGYARLARTAASPYVKPATPPPSTLNRTL
jgi:hypothetical protein